jgi:hypothetical protein
MFAGAGTLSSGAGGFAIGTLSAGAGAMGTSCGGAVARFKICAIWM